MTSLLRSFALSAILLCTSLYSQEGGYDRTLASGHERAYDFNTPELTPSPKGYTPFYISHYGRHGSRYAWDINTYTSVLEAFERAEKAGVLTDEGNRLYSEYKNFSSEAIMNYGCLVSLGSEQHRKLAQRMARNFPEVFRKGKAFARSSTSQRAVASMAAFLVSLQKEIPSLDIETQVLASDLSVTKSQLLENTEHTLSLREENSLSLGTKKDYMLSHIDCKPITGKLFKSSSEIFSSPYDEAFFCLSLYYLWSGYHNYVDSDFLEEVFTEDQALKLWEAGNFYDYKSTVDNYKIRIGNLLKDIVERAEKAMTKGGNSVVSADFRFGHDVVISMFLMELGLEGMDSSLPSCPDSVKNCFRNYKVPMASNLQFVLYRPKNGRGEILFKLLLNETEIPVAGLNSVDGPYYRWEDFKQLASKFICE